MKTSSDVRELVITSAGMLCSERELGLSDDHSGIFILPDSFVVGGLLENVACIRDSVFDINVPPNRLRRSYTKTPLFSCLQRLRF